MPSVFIPVQVFVLEKRKNDKQKSRNEMAQVKSQWGIEVFGYFLDLALAPKERDKDDDSDS